MSNFLNHLQQSILASQSFNSKLSQEALNIQGLSSFKIKHLLNNILSYQQLNYLEIGVLTGSTFVAANYLNDLNVSYAIDNWLEFQAEGTNNKKILEDNLKKFGITNYTLFETDSFDFDISQIKEKIHVYFYDGGHSYEQQYKALQYYYDVLDDEFIFLVDDYNWDDVQRGTQDSIRDLKMNILYENYLQGNCDINNGYWNGLYVCYLKK
jgi:hypothetical protein